MLVNAVTVVVVFNINFKELADHPNLNRGWTNNYPDIPRRSKVNEEHDDDNFQEVHGAYITFEDLVQNSDNPRISWGMLGVSSNMAVTINWVKHFQHKPWNWRCLQENSRFTIEWLQYYKPHKDDSIICCEYLTFVEVKALRSIDRSLDFLICENSFYREMRDFYRNEFRQHFMGRNGNKDQCLFMDLKQKHHSISES